MIKVMTTMRHKLKILILTLFSIGEPCAPLAYGSSADTIVSSNAQDNFRFREKLDDLYKKLNLSAEQQDQFTAIIDKARPEVEMRLEILGANQIKLKGFVFTQKYDASKVKVLAKQQGKLFAELIELNTHLKYQVYQILNQQQRQQMQHIIGKKQKLD